MIKIVTVQFDYDNENKYQVLLDVLKYSAQKNMSGAEFVDIRTGPPEMQYIPGYKMLKSNTFKLEKWVEEIEKSNRHDRIALLDADMLIMRDFSSVFDYKFDVAYTYRMPYARPPLPLNGGAMFVKPTRKAKSFFREYLEVNERFLKNKKDHDPWRRVYAGMNQAALGYMLERSKNRAKVLSLPCPKWNVCNEDWHKMRKDAYILHVKSRLRLMCLGQKKPSRDIKKVVDLWKTYYEGLKANET